jgi:hypothetical protein
MKLRQDAHVVPVVGMSARGEPFCSAQDLVAVKGERHPALYFAFYFDFA